MPFFILNTNLARSKIPPGFLLQTTEMLAGLLDKPAEAICVHLNTDQLLSYAGTDEPAASGSLSSIGKVGGDLNERLTTEIYAFLEKNLPIRPARLGIEFRNLVPTEVARNAQTMAAAQRADQTKKN